MRVFLLFVAIVAGCTPTDPGESPGRTEGTLGSTLTGESTRLNNFVVAHVDAVLPAVPPTHDPTHPVRTYTIETTRDGWVFFSLDGAEQRAWLTIDGLEIAASDLQDGETMRFLSRGSHAVSVFAEADTPQVALVVRSIPEILLYPASFDAWEQETDGNNYAIRHDWSFYEDHLNHNANSIAFYSVEDHISAIEEWHSRGRHALLKENLPTCSTPDCYWDWLALPLQDQPLLSGLTVDELGGGMSEASFDGFAQTLDDIGSSEELGGKRVYTFWGGETPSEDMQRLVKPVQRQGFPWLHEGYFILSTNEGYSESAQLAFITRWAGTPFLEVEQAMPGVVENNLMYVFGIYNHHWSLDNTPSLDFKVFLDLQFHHVATHEGLEGIYGLVLYTLNHSTEEILRYASALVRHYGLEGHQTRFNDDSLRLTHIANPGFEEGLAGWTIHAPAASDVTVIANDDLPFYNDVSDRPVPSEDHALTSVRNPDGPTTLSQTLVQLQPGRAYSVRVMNTDLSRPETDALVDAAIQIDGAELLPDQPQDRTWTSTYWAADTHEEVTVTWSWRMRVFRALSDSATLTLSDWPDPTGPGDDVGHTIVWDFVQVQPFYEG